MSFFVIYCFDPKSESERMRLWERELVIGSGGGFNLYYEKSGKMKYHKNTSRLFYYRTF